MEIRKYRKDIAFIIAFILASTVLLLIPTGFERAIYVNAVGAKAEVLSTDDRGIIQTGLFRTGDQRCHVRVLSGEHKGLEMDGINLLSGSLKEDKVFVPGDTAWVLIERDTDGNPIFINLIDYYRIGTEWILVIAFALRNTHDPFIHLRVLRDMEDAHTCRAERCFSISYVYAYLDSPDSRDASYGIRGEQKIACGNMRSAPEYVDHSSSIAFHDKDTSYTWLCAGKQ